MIYLSFYILFNLLYHVTQWKLLDSVDVQGAIWMDALY